jgi:hypothetical protein
MTDIPLANGLTYRPAVSGGVLSDDEVFNTHLATARLGVDRLAANYTVEAMSRMTEYGYVYESDPENLVYMTGIEDFGSGCYRVESRTFVPPHRRSRYWRCPDNYQSSITQIGKLNNPNLLFKSREAVNGAGIAVSIKQAPHLFGDWVAHPTKIELRYPNNWQFIIYKSVRGIAAQHIASLEYHGIHD